MQVCPGAEGQEQEVQSYAADDQVWSKHFFGVKKILVSVPSTPFYIFNFTFKILSGLFTYL